MRLYTYFRRSCAYRVRIGLNLKGLKYDSVSIHLRKAEHQTEQYAAVNVQRLVPALLHPTGAIPQSIAILEFLNEEYPDPPLLPARPDERAQVRAMALAVACDIHPSTICVFSNT